MCSEEGHIGKYEPVRIYLIGLPVGTRDKTLRFAQIEQIIGASLPASAHRYREWWSNQKDTSNRPQARAWIEAGWEVAIVNQDEEWVRFKRAQKRGDEA